MQTADFTFPDLKSSGEIFHLDNGIWRTAVSTYGGQLLQSFHRSSSREVFFLGSRASAKNGQSIRGGSPVCWPWFGASPVEGRPIQGFARTALWQLAALEKESIKLQLPPEAVREELMDFPFELYSEIHLTDDLEIALTMKNCGTSPVDITCALHSYFAVSDCEKVTVKGFEETPFTVKGGPEESAEKRPLQIKGEICRLYFPQSQIMEISDPLWKRKILIENTNSRSSLVWNPGAERCRQIPDLEDEEFHRFVCIECNRAGEDHLRLLPGESFRIAQTISVKPL